MNLYVWKKFFPDCDDGVAFAIAENEESARKLVIDSFPENMRSWIEEPWDWGPSQILPIAPVGYGVTGGG
jgi:hypothetical protein